MSQKISVLTYHGIHVDGTDYSNNDHIGFAEDLSRLHQAGYHVIGLDRLVQAVVSGNWVDIPERGVDNR